MKRLRPIPREYSVTEPLIAARFWSKVDVARPRLDKDPCWEWREGLDTKGYGQFTPVSCASPLRAHRVAYELIKGPIPSGMQVLHSCDNTRCCNPNHLRVGTHQDNMRDMTERGRGHFNREGAASVAGKRGGRRRSFLSKWEAVIKRPLPGDHP